MSTSSLNRRKHRRDVMKIFRKVNKAIMDDPLWQGRFIVNPIDFQWYQFEDMSGGFLIMHYEIVDKKTGYAKLYHEEESLFWASRLAWNVNNFIVEDIAVWENEKPYEEKQDWTNVKIKPWSLPQWRQVEFPYYYKVRREVSAQCPE